MFQLQVGLSLRHRWLLLVLGCAEPHVAEPHVAPPLVVRTEAPVVAVERTPRAPLRAWEEAEQEAPPAGLVCFARAYEGTLRRADGRWTLALADGTSIPWKKRDEERSDASPFDLSESYEQPYPRGAITPVTNEHQNPGRVRVDELFFARYGKSAADVQKQLVAVAVGGKTFMVHAKIAPPLKNVAARLAIAMKKDPSLARFFASPGGTFNWRFIAGTRELSMHAWGIAIDLDVGLADYWRNFKTVAWRNRYPQAIVDAFEAEGFVWGGRWFYFDTMHFEYRPELLDPSCYAP